jgi:hypothetical protein
MAQLSLSNARVVDPILSTVAQGYRHQMAVGGFLFPYVPVGQRGGKIISFGREDFALYNTVRTPGSPTRRVQFGYAGQSYALESHALEALVPNELLEEALAVPGINLATMKVAKVQSIIALRLEFLQAQLAINAANYAASNKTALSGTSQWSDLTAGVSDPVNVVEVGKEAVRAQIGQTPNTMVIPAKVMVSLKQHPKIIDRIKYTGRDIPTPELLASLFDVERVVVGKMIYTDAAGLVQDVWGKSVVLAYTDTASMAEAGAPTFGYTYRLNGYPMVRAPYPDENANSWVYPVADEVMPVIAGASAGYLISMSKTKANTPAVDAAATVSVEVLSPINHDGVQSEVGDILDGLTLKQAQSLVDAGAAKLAD